MRAQSIAAIAVVLVLFLAPNLTSQSPSDPAAELAKKSAEMKEEFGLSDEDLLSAFRKFHNTGKAIASITKDEDVWGPDGYTPEDLRKLFKEVVESSQRMNNMSMLTAVEALKLLNAGDVDGTKIFLRGDLAIRYSSAVASGASSDDFVLVRVRELAETDAVLNRLIEEKLKSKQEEGAKSAVSPEPK